MSKDNQHNVKIVWDEPVKEAHLAYPKRDFASLNHRVKRRKRLVHVLKGTIVLIVLIGTLVIISLSKSPKNQTETPTTPTRLGPEYEPVPSYNWSNIGTIKQKNIPVGIHEIQEQKDQNTQPPQETRAEAIIDGEGKDESAARKVGEPDPVEPKEQQSDTLQQEQQTFQIKEDTAPKDSNAVTQKPFVPSEFTRAYPTVGYDSLYRYLTEYINQELLGSNSDGDTLRISFAIEADGHPSGIRLSLDTSDSVFMKIEEVVQNMPTWEPARANDQPIVTRFRLPLIIQSKTIREEE